MDVQKKLSMGINELVANGPITIVALGDSVTHASFEMDRMDYEAVYWNRLRQMIDAKNHFIPTNIINAGIGGGTAHIALPRLQRQCLDHHPDVVLVCFGLNDINLELQEYKESLEEIFRRCREADAQPILITPNMLNTYVADDVDERYHEYAAQTAEWQNGGRMDAFMDGAREVAAAMNVPVCDLYAHWKELSKTQDTTMMLANRINHPNRESHEWIAQQLFMMLFPDTLAKDEVAANKDVNTSTMYVDH